MEKITDKRLKSRLIEARGTILEFSVFPKREWVRETGLGVVAAENIAHFYDEEIERLTRAFARNGDTKLFAISNEQYSFESDHAYELVPSFDEFERLERAYFGEFFMLMNQNQTVVITFSPAGDIKLVAAPVSFLVDYGGDLHVQRQDFIEFMGAQLAGIHVNVGYRKNMRRALEYMDWIAADA